MSKCATHPFASIIPGIVLMLASLCFVPCAGAGQRVLIVGDSSYPPYSYVHGGQPTGIYPEILRRAFARMPDFDVTIQMMPWKRALALVKAGRAMGIFPPYRRDAQRPYISPYSLQILKEEVIVLCTANALPADSPARWPEDFGELTFSSNSGFALGSRDYLSDLYGKEVSHTEVHDAEAGLLMLLYGNVDCYINERRSIDWARNALASRGWENSARFKEAATLNTEYGHIGYSARSTTPGKAAFIRQFDDVIADMKQTGEIDVIVNDYLRRISGYSYDR